MSIGEILLRSRYQPLKRVLSYDVFNTGFNGWMTLMPNFTEYPDFDVPNAANAHAHPHREGKRSHGASLPHRGTDERFAELDQRIDQVHADAEPAAHARAKPEERLPVFEAV